MPLDDTKSAEDLANEIHERIEEVKGIAQDALGKAETGENLSAAEKQKADEALTELNGVKSRLDDLEQKAARGGGEEAMEGSYGERFTASDGFKSFAGDARDGTRTSLTFDAKNDMTTTTGGAGGMGAMVHPNYRPGLTMLPDRRMTIRNLIAPGQTDSPIISYDRETGFNNAAGMVAEGDVKPQSDITIEEVTVNTRVIAHWMRVTQQALSDVPQMRTIIDGRLSYGLDFKEEGQLLNGDGTGQNLNGLITQATAYAKPDASLTDPSQIIDTLRYAMLQAALAEYPASGHVINPIDWARIETLKDTDGNYIIGLPQGTASPTMWGLPVVATQAMQVDKFLTGSFNMAAQIFDQWALRIETGFQNDDFTRNKVTVLAEKRLALAVYRPEALIYGDFGNVA